MTTYTNAKTFARTLALSLTTLALVLAGAHPSYAHGEGVEPVAEVTAEPAAGNSMTVMIIGAAIVVVVIAAIGVIAFARSKSTRTSD